MNYNILITGCHGDIALSILKIVKSHYPGMKSFGADAVDDGVGKVFFQTTFTLPKVNDPKYLEALKKELRDRKIDVLIPASEPEMRFLGKNLKTYELEGAKIIMADKKSHDVGFDKLITYDFLKESDLPYIKTLRGDEKLTLPYPVIYKPRAGAGSRGISILNNEHDLKELGQTDAAGIFQEYVGSPDDEYTCGIFSNKKEVRTICVKRTLRYGLTLTAHPIENPAIDAVLVKLAKAIELEGSINIQLRLDHLGVPRIFEINPRFSSTVYYRHAIGFKDVIWSIEKAFNLPLSPYSGFMKKKLYRHFEDAVVEY